MTADQQTLLMFKGLIASLSEESQVKVKEAATKLRAIIADYPGGEATVAFGMIGAELQMGDSEMITKWNHSSCNHSNDNNYQFYRGGGQKLPKKFPK